MTHQLVTEKVASKAWARLWPLRRQEKGAFKLVFENCPWKIQTDFVKTRELQTQEFELINFYTFSRRHVDFWARVKGSKGIVDENIG